MTAVKWPLNKGEMRTSTNEGKLTHSLNRLLEKKGRRQQFYDSWHSRYFVIKHGYVQHWRSKEVCRGCISICTVLTVVVRIMTNWSHPETR